MMHKIEINWMELEAAFQMGSGEFMEWLNYLDLETGEVIAIESQALRYAEQPDEEEVPEWMQDEVEKARQLEAGYGSRYVAIPGQDSHEGYRDMERFIATVRNDRLRDRLWQAIQGRGAFRYFKDVLYEHPAEQERWFAFQAHREHERILGWLESEGIEPLNPKELAEVPEPEEADEEVDDALLEELTLLLIYLSSWEEEVAPGHTLHRAWKGYLIEVLDALEEQGYVSQTRRAKSLALTEAGVERAKEIRGERKI